MKKQILFLSAAFIMSASAMFAQTQFYTGNPFYDEQGQGNDFYTDQWADGYRPVVEMDKSGCVDCEVDNITVFTYFSYDGENNSVVNQTGDNNGANVLQIGDTNYSMINQQGDDNFGGVGGSWNDARIYQRGSSNYSDVLQDGDYNDSDVIQIGNDNYGKQEVGDGFAENNKTYLRQEGNGNASVQTQWLDGNVARVKQLSDNNTAIQTQTSLDQHGAGTGNFASIWQYGGNGNGAQQTQTGTHNYAWAEQDGTENTSVSTQTGSSNAGTGFFSNYSSTLQIGDNNLACVNQIAGSESANLSAIYQIGNDNKAGVTQTTDAFGWGNLSYISQYGNMNTASVTQINGTPF